MDDRQEMMAHLEELHQALIDWNRYQAKVSLSDLRASRDTRNMVLHALLVAIQASLDLAAHLIAAKRLERPATYRQAFEILTEKGFLPTRLGEKLAELASFRNVLVHIYWRLDLERVFDLLQTGYDPLVEFCRTVVRLMEE
ncbi:MAG: DUF86 domain-containing protein [Bacillota bacterium]